MGPIELGGFLYVIFPGSIVVSAHAECMSFLISNVRAKRRMTVGLEMENDGYIDFARFQDRVAIVLGHLFVLLIDVMWCAVHQSICASIPIQFVSVPYAHKQDERSQSIFGLYVRFSLAVN